jgi:PAS domain S-box-containing protein
MGFIHPDDREKVQAVHMAAFKDHLPYHMEERIVRPDGEVRILDSTGEVALDDEGNPVRMYGICRDITEQRRAEEQARRHGERFEALVESSPDALLVVNRDGVIVQVNKRTEAAFGYASEELIGQPVECLLPPEMVDAHRGHRDSFMDDPTARGMGTGIEVAVRHRNGTDIPVDISLGVLTTDEGMVVAAFVRDISERKRAEEYALRLHDAGVRRRHALEINDNVVQGLSAALYAFDAGLQDEALAALRCTVASARLMMNDLLAESGDCELTAGDLERAQPAATMLPLIPQTTSGGTGGRRVLLVDDATDIRVLTRRVFSATDGFEVVGEAVNGREAIDCAAELSPDVVLLDLAMPVMDGLEALPHLRELLPHATIVVLSGFDSERMRQPALQAGADAYIEKGGSLVSVLSAIRDALAAA